MAKTFHVNISMPDKICVDKECVSVNMPTVKGYITILPHHAPLISALEPGYLTITYEDGSKYIGLINNGVFRFKDNKLTILSDFFEKKEKVNPNVLKEIRQKISQAMKDEVLLNKTSTSLNAFTKLVTTKANKEDTKH